MFHAASAPRPSAVAIVKVAGTTRAPGDRKRKSEQVPKTTMPIPAYVGAARRAGSIASIAVSPPAQARLAAAALHDRIRGHAWLHVVASAASTRATTAARIGTIRPA